MSINRILLWLLLAIATLNLIYMILKKTERFEDVDAEITLKNQINAQITKFNDAFCPIYTELLNNRLDKIIDDHDNKLDEFYKSGIYKLLGPEKQKIYKLEHPKTSEMTKEQQLAFKCNAKSQALQSIKDDTMYETSTNPINIGPIRKKISDSSLLFPCPAYNDPILVPNDIDRYIEQTSKVYIQFINEVKTKIEDALSCKQGFMNPPQSNTPDDSACASIVEAKAEAKKIEAGKTEAEKANDANLKLQRIQALQLKTNALQKAFANPLFISLVDKYNELKEIKRKAENGELKPNCSS